MVKKISRKVLSITLTIALLISVGLNSITIYLAQRIVSFWGISEFFVGGLAGICPEPVGKLILAVGYFTVSWLFLWFLYKKKVFLKV